MMKRVIRMESIVRKCDENSLHDDDAQEIFVIMDYITIKTPNQKNVVFTSVQTEDIFSHVGIFDAIAPLTFSLVSSREGLEVEKA